METLRIQGTEVPRLGFGTWQITGPECEEAVRDALEIGYRHLDTARAYDNEREVGRGLAGSGVDREDVFLTTKVWMEDLEPRRLRDSAEASLRDLAVDHVDLLLIHWPSEEVPLERTLEAMSELQDEGRVRRLGVSNFPPRLLRQAVELAPIFCDQVEMHPFLGQDELLGIAADRDLMVTAYAPLAQGRVVDDPVLQEIGDAHGKSAGQVALRWLLDQPRVSPIPKASRHERRVENFEVFDFSLSEEERARIDSLPKDHRHFEPEWGPDWES